MDQWFAKVVYSAFLGLLSNWISLWFDCNMKVGYLLSSVLYGDTESFLWVIDPVLSSLFQGSHLTITQRIIFAVVKSKSKANRARTELSVDLVFVWIPPGSLRNSGGH